MSKVGTRVDSIAMHINLPMLRRNVQRALSGRCVELQALAERRWTVCQGADRRVPAAIYPPDAIEKVSRLCDTRDHSHEMILMHGGVLHDAPTEAYLVRNVDLVDAHLYSRSARHQSGFGEEHVLVKDLPPKRHFQHATLVGNRSGSYYFGNFLWDDLPLEILDAEVDSHVAVTKKQYDHEAGYRELLDLPPPPVERHAKFDELTIFTDFAQNESKEQRLRELRARLRRHVRPLHANHPGIYIRRGYTGERRVMENEPDVERLLASQGFVIIDPTALSAREVAEQSLGAKLVIGVEGSHLAHGLYTMDDDAAFLVLQPPTRFSLVHKEFADRLGMRYGFVTGSASAQGFSVCLSDLETMVGRLC